MLSNSVNLFSENMHSSASLTGMSLTKISFVLWCMSNCSCAKCLTVCKATVPMKLMAWPNGLKAGWADLSAPSARQDLHLFRRMSQWFPLSFHFLSFFFLNRILLFHAFWLLRISDVAGSCFQHFFHIYKDWEPSVGLFVYECTSQSFKSCAEDGGRRKRGPDSALIINSGETAAERTGTCHVVPRCTASFIKPCINIRPCKNCWKIAAQMPRKKCCFLV